MNFFDMALAAVPGVGEYMGAKDANEKNLQIAREQMAFQERMSNTAYQRATADMRGAGVNPMLAYSQGGASTPPGASATMVNEKASLSKTTASALEALAMNKDFQKKNKEIDLLEEQKQKTQADKRKSQSEAEIAKLHERDTDFLQRAKEGDPAVVGNNNGSVYVPKYYKVLNDAITKQNQASAKQAEVEAKHSEYDKTVAPFDAVLRRWQSVMAPLSTAKQVFAPQQMPLPPNKTETTETYTIPDRSSTTTRKTTYGR